VHSLIDTVSAEVELPLRNKLYSAATLLESAGCKGTPQSLVSNKKLINKPNPVKQTNTTIKQHPYHIKTTASVTPSLTAVLVKLCLSSFPCFPLVRAIVKVDLFEDFEVDGRGSY
jgi:hypothetical protein